MSIPIQLNIIESSTPEVFDYICYPDQHPSTYQYISNQFQNISSTIMESGRRFIEDSRNLFSQFYDSSVERAARAALRMAKSLRHPNAINRLDSLEDIQAAPPLMQRYIMSEPYIRQKYHEQLCSGFGGSYIDMEPGFLKENHYDWRRVHDGILRFEGEGEDEEWIATEYIEDLREGDRDLTFEEKLDILHTQDIARLFMEQGLDSTCPFGSKIG